MELKRVLGDARRELFLARVAVKDGNYDKAVRYIRFVLKDVDKLSKYVERMNEDRMIAASLSRVVFLTPP